MGAAVATQARTFLVKLGKAVQEDDEKQVASMVHYPIKVHAGDRTFVVHDPEEFMRNYERIVNRSVKAKNLDENSSRCLFSNRGGFMVGDGEVWFKEFSAGVFKVVTFNLADLPDGATPTSTLPSSWQQKQNRQAEVMYAAQAARSRAVSCPTE